MTVPLTCCCGRQYPVSPQAVPGNVQCECGAVWNMGGSAQIGPHVGVAFVLVREPDPPKQDEPEQPQLENAA